MTANESDNIDVGGAVASELSGVWTIAKSAFFAEYLSGRYKRHIDLLPSWEKLVIAEAAEANFEEMYFSSPLVTRFWCVDNRGFHEDPSPSVDEREVGLYYLVPTIRFCANKDSVLVSERFGPTLMYRRLQELLTDGGCIRLGKLVKEKLF